MKKIITLIVIALLSFNIKAQTFSWAGFVPIFDFQTDTIPIVVSGLPTVIDTSFGLAHICMNITHTYKSDLVMTMVSPDGTNITLIQNIGGSADNFLGTCLGMDGTSFSNSAAPYTGLFVPTGNISLFNNGQNPNGTWLFIVSDQANVDTGSVHTVSIAFTNNPPRPAGTSSGGGPTGIYVCPTCVCPGGASSCDLLPDMTSSAKEILLNHNETPGALYISNATPNIGYGPIDIFGIDSCFCGTTYVPCTTICPNGVEIKHVVKQRIYHKVAGNDTLTYYDRIAGTMTYHPSHGHIHVDHWADYTLRTPTSNPDATTWPIVGTGVKQSFCLVNLGTCSGNNGECLDNNNNVITTVPNQNVGFHTGCGLTQGIYPGNYDVYSISLNDPIPLVNVCNGNYYIVSITDPDNNFLESDETNNWVAVPITLTQQNVAPSITASGSTVICLGDSVTLTASPASNYLWSTGDTIQSIVVKNSGSYSVSSDCGTSVATSSPVVVTATQVNITASAIPSTTGCSGDTVHLTASATSAGTQNIPATFTSNQQVFIPDNYPTGVTSAITVSGINPATLSTNTIVSVKLNLTHTYDGDLAISLIAPSGNTIFLSNRRGVGGDNFINCVFTMSASTLISAGAAPFTGSYVPDENFSSLTGNVNGIWTLKVQDLAAVDTGSIQNWNIVISNLVPETFSYSWSSVPPGFSSTQQNPVANPLTSINYFVTINSNSTGCVATQSVPVSIPSINNISPLFGLPGTWMDISGNGFSNVSAVTIAGVPADSFIVINSNLIQALVPNLLNASDVVCVTTLNNCSFCSNADFTIDTSVSLNLKLFIEGFYLSNGVMQATVDFNNYPVLCDTIIVELHHALSPYSFAYSDKSTINIYGVGNFIFPPDVIGNSYYLVVRHRNALETWSASPVLFNNTFVSYNFSDAKSKAFGNNQRDMNDGNFAIMSGDISDAFTATVGIQDGIVESQDYSDMETAVFFSLTGYITEDITGDGIVESSDYSLLQNNVYYTVYSIRP